MGRLISSVDGFISLKGQELGVSKWIDITQDLIDNFGEVTDDHQWIHVNPQMANEKSPFKSTIAHGYLTLSLLPCLLLDIIELHNLHHYVNYSIEKMVYKAVVPVGSRLRMRAFLKSAKDLGEICQAKIQCTFEIEGSDNPVLEGEIVFLYYFDSYYSKQ